MRYASPDGGSDPNAFEPTDEPIHRQHIRNPAWNEVTRGTGVAGRYDRLPNQYTPLLAEYPEQNIAPFVLKPLSEREPLTVHEQLLVI